MRSPGCLFSRQEVSLFLSYNRGYTKQHDAFLLTPDRGDVNTKYTKTERNYHSGKGSRGFGYLIHLTTPPSPPRGVGTKVSTRCYFRAYVVGVVCMICETVPERHTPPHQVK